MCLFEKKAYFFTPNIQMSEFELKRMIKLNEVTFKVVASADGRYHELCFSFKKMSIKNSPGRFFVSIFQLRNNMGLPYPVSFLYFTHAASMTQ